MAPLGLPEGRQGVHPEGRLARGAASGPHRRPLRPPPGEEGQPQARPEALPRLRGGLQGGEPALLERHGEGPPGPQEGPGGPASEGLPRGPRGRRDRAHGAQRRRPRGRHHPGARGAEALWRARGAGLVGRGSPEAPLAQGRRHLPAAPRPHAGRPPCRAGGRLPRAGRGWPRGPVVGGEQRQGGRVGRPRLDRVRSAGQPQGH
mmetsp:Transcript_17622/g.55217  ORF Transcript_17622/g.55217 Transcript_17622/m.55217 type:complete len:204 (-) Transcript_17622:267-878(-)